MRILLSLVLIVVAFDPADTSAQSATAPFSKVSVNSKSSIIIMRAANAGTIGGFSKPRVQYECLTFKNMDRRTATEIVFHFRYYNDVGDHVGDDVLTRNGTFSYGATIEGVSNRSTDVHQENCVEIHYPKDGISLVTMWVDRATYDDATTWTAGDLHLPEHLPNWRPTNTAPGTQQPVPQTSSDPDLRRSNKL